MSEYAVERARQIFQARQASRGASGRRVAEADPDAAPGDGAEAGDVIGTLHLIHSRLRRLDGWLREEHQLNLTEMYVLSMIPAASSAPGAVGRGEATARLAREVELSPSGLTRLVDRLVTRGLVARVDDAWDGRVTHPVLTERGRDVRDAVLPRAVERIRDSCDADGPPLDRLRAIFTAPGDGPARRLTGDAEQAKDRP
jgi:DNA-binding MarR family transcriptional regulator